MLGGVGVGVSREGVGGVGSWSVWGGVGVGINGS